MMDSCEEDSDQDWSEAWDKDLTDHANITGTVASDVAGSSETSETTNATQRDDPRSDENKSSLMSRMKLNDNKAGMEGIDRERINQIIYEASKGSRFYENEKKKEEQVNRRIEEQMRKLPRLSEADIQQGVIVADRLLAKLEASRDLSRTIVHIDMDAFFAAVEMRENPKLRNVPMAVGSNSMLSTSNYLARRYGVRAAMPGFIGKKLCPELVILPAIHEKYSAVSKDIRRILYQYDPSMCPMSLDEAYLDITEHVKNRKNLTEEQRTYCRQLLEEEVCSCTQNTKINQQTASNEKESDDNRVTGSRSSALDSHQNDRCVTCSKPKTVGSEVITFGISVEEAVREMRFRIHAETKLTASAGIAPNMLLAKVCSDKNKPNGQYMIQPNKLAVFNFIRDLPIRKVCGIGKVSEKMLAALNVTTCADLYNKRGLLYHLYSNISFNYFMRVCIGIGSTRVERDDQRKSIGVERTFREICKPAQLYKMCYELSELLTDDMNKEQLLGKTVTLKLKLSNFEMRTRSQSQPHHIRDKEDIYDAAKEILKQEIQAAAPGLLRLRLMGIRMTNLINENEITKQQTIQGLFQKFQPKRDTDMGCSSSYRSQSESINSHSEKSPNDIKCNLESGDVIQDQANPAKSELTLDPGMKRNTIMELSSGEMNPLKILTNTDIPQDEARAALNLDSESCEEQKAVCEVSANQMKACGHCSDVCERPLAISICSDEECKELSLFGYVSHLKTDFVELNKSLCFQDHMTGHMTGQEPPWESSEDDTRELNSNVKEAASFSTENMASSGSDSEINNSRDNDTRPFEQSIEDDCLEGMTDASHVDEVSLSVTAQRDEQAQHGKDFFEAWSGNEQAEVLVNDTEQTNDNRQKEHQSYECPVCYVRASFASLHSFTDHIDECLARRCIADDNGNDWPKSQPDGKHVASESGSSRKDATRVEGVRNQSPSHRDSDPEASDVSHAILVCPVCHAPQRKSSITMFNQHVDACLNRQTIKEIVQETHSITTKRMVASDDIHTPSKKQKTDHRSTPAKTSKPTILSFFLSQHR